MPGVKRSHQQTTGTTVTNSRIHRNIMIRTRFSSTTSSSSYDLQDVWKRSCWKAMGYIAEHDDDDDDHDDCFDLDDTWELVNDDTDTAKNNNNNINLSSTSFQVINLMPSTMNDDDEILYTEGDTATTNVDTDTPPMVVFMNLSQQIHDNIITMRNWLQQKQLIYIQWTTSDAEASLIQSTMTSFTATTANEIESLHQILPHCHPNHHHHHSHNTNTTSQSSQLQQHYSSMVQILMMELQDTIAIPFQSLTKLRQRTAVQIYQHPIQCSYNNNKTNNSNTSRQPTTKYKDHTERDTTLELLGLDDDDENDEIGSTIGTTKIMDQRFIPTRPSHRLHQDFYSTYQPTNNNNKNNELKPRPISIFVSASSPGGGATTMSTSTVSPGLSSNDTMENITMKRSNVQDKTKSRKYDPNIATTITTTVVDDDEYDSTTTATMLQQESILLQMKTNNDLDHVQQMEQTMIDITTLLSQFTNLVVEQQDNIHTIYDSTTVTQDNVQQGTEQLHDAKIRVQSSKHYMATLITGMGIVLLVFHWLRP